MSDQRGTIPYWRLSGFYFIYFATLGSLLPYFGLYLQSSGFNAIDIGLLMACLHGTKLIAPNIWGWIADRSGRSMGMIRIASFIAAIVFCGLFFEIKFWWVATTMILFSFFWNAALPQFEAVTLSHLRQDSHRYSMIRVWGSIGFILTVVGIGKGLDYYSIKNLPVVVFCLLSGIWFMSLLVPEIPLPNSDSKGKRLFLIIQSSKVLAFFLVCFLIQASHGPYYVFFTIHLEEQGYSGSTIGLLWGLGVAAEVVLFAVIHKLLKHFSLRIIMLVSLSLAVIRWLLIAWGVEQLSLLVIAQLLHAATFGATHIVAIHLVHRYFQGQNQVRGQALYSSISFGAGGILGSLYSGKLWESQGAEVVYIIAAVLSFIALFVAWRWVDKTDLTQ